MDTVKPQIPGAIENQMAVELADFPTTTNHGVEALKDIIYGSVGFVFCSLLSRISYPVSSSLLKYGK